MNKDQKIYNKFYKDQDWDHKLVELKWQIKSYLKYISLKRKAPIKTVLDIGCGTGDYCYFFDYMGFEVAGIDFAKSAIEKARRKYGQLEFYEANASNFDLSKKFDLLFVSGFSVFNTDDLSKPKKIISNWTSELEKKGTILILSRTDFTGKKSRSGWFFHTEEQIENMFSHPDFNSTIYYAYPKLRYLILLPFFNTFWAKIAHVVSKYFFANILKKPIRYMVIMTKKS